MWNSASVSRGDGCLHSSLYWLQRGSITAAGRAASNEHQPAIYEHSIRLGLAPHINAIARSADRGARYLSLRPQIIFLNKKRTDKFGLHYPPGIASSGICGECFMSALFRGVLRPATSTKDRIFSFISRSTRIPPHR